MKAVREACAALGLALVLFGPGQARAESGDEVRLSCLRQAAPGRVLCELEVEVARGRLAWADALVLRAPDTARPLRARVGPPSATGGTGRRLRLPLALAATATGSGELVVKARFVTCARAAGGKELCSPSSREVKARVEVGSSAAAN